jgi:hypothetical protein
MHHATGILLITPKGRMSAAEISRNGTGGSYCFEIANQLVQHFVATVLNRPHPSS